MAKNFSIAVKENNGKRKGEGKISWKKFADILPSLFTGVSRGADGGIGTMCVARGIYDFSKHGGAVGDYNLLSSDELIPANAIILNVVVDPITTVASSASGELAFKVVNTADLKAASTTYTAGTELLGVPDFATIADNIKLTTPKNLVASITVGALTAGKVACFVFYVISE